METLRVFPLARERRSVRTSGSTVEVQGTKAASIVYDDINLHESDLTHTGTENWRKRDPVAREKYLHIVGLEDFKKPLVSQVNRIT